MPNPDLTFYDCRRDTEMPLGVENVDVCIRWLNSQKIEFKNILANADGTLRLNLSGTKITDLSPLTILPVTHLCLAGCWWIKDFTPLGRMSLVWLNLKRTGITDLTPLRNLPLIHLSIYWTKIATLSPVARLPLRRLDIRFTQITTMLSLRQMPLEELLFFPSRIRTGMDSLRSVRTLMRINRWTAEVFWNRHR
jgi:hypothetical protein